MLSKANFVLIFVFGNISKNQDSFNVIGDKISPLPSAQLEKPLIKKGISDPS